MSYKIEFTKTGEEKHSTTTQQVVVRPTKSTTVRALGRSRHAAAAAEFVAPPTPTLADRRAVAAAADILGRLSARRGACGQLVIHRGEYS